MTMITGSTAEAETGWIETVGLLRAARSGVRRHWPTAHPADVPVGADADVPVLTPCQAIRRRRAAGPRPCTRLATARVTGAQRSTADLCTQHARMAADRPRLVREWSGATGGRAPGGGQGDAPGGPDAIPSPGGTHAELELGVGADLSAPAIIRARLSHALSRAGWTPDLQEPLLLAASEAAANAVEHGSRPGGRVRVTMQAGPGWAWIRVADGGRLGSVIPLVPPAPPPSTHCRGRGLLLMRRLSQRMSLHSGGHGTVVLLEFADAAAGGGR